jgi:hypothetical protein
MHTASERSLRACSACLGSRCQLLAGLVNKGSSVLTHLFILRTSSEHGKDVGLLWNANRGQTIEVI